MPEGAAACAGTWLRQEGEMRFSPDRPWMPFTAEQWFRGSGVDFRWQASVRMAPFIRARVVDSFEDGRGTLRARILGFIPVAASTGPATDRGEAMRGLAELPWRPAAFRELRRLSWELVAADKVRGTFNDQTTRAAVDFLVDDDGQVLGGASHRPRMVGESVVETAWSGSFRNYKMFEGLRVPTSAEASWHLPDGPFPYWRGRVVEFRVLR